MNTLIKTFITKHTPPILSILMAIGGATYYLGDVVTSQFASMKTELITEARLPAYEMLYSSLNKQSEKIDTDPGDIKTSDISLLYNQCNSDFGLIYIPSLAPTKRLNGLRTCEKLGDMYLERNVY